MGSFGSDCSGLEGLEMCACVCISAAAVSRLMLFANLFTVMILFIFL